MKQSWINSVLPIAAIFSFRMLGLFMLIPVFTLYAMHLPGASPALVGIALGGYGLSQGLLQIPFGLLSDYFGRKRMIAIGLWLFVLGSLVGALSSTIYGIIAARILQGSGAIGSVLIALLADVTPDNVRTKAMAIIGVTIGTSFSVAMVSSPSIARYFGLSGIFYVTVFLACLGLLLLRSIPVPQHAAVLNKKAPRMALKHILANPHLWRLNIGIFFQHFILTATFFVFPMVLQDHMQYGNEASAWHFYLPVMVIAFLSMIPFIHISEKKNYLKFIFSGSILSTVICQSLLAYAQYNWIVLCCLMIVYFIGFNILEACLPSLISRQAAGEHKGTAMGVYSSSQFLGIFVGGTVAGLLFPIVTRQGIFLINASIACVWFLIGLKQTYPHDATESSDKGVAVG